MIIGRGRTPKLLQLSFLVFVLSIAIIGRRGSKAPIPPAHRPVTRSHDPEPTTNLVSKPDVMGEYASAESVQALQAAVTAMQTEQGEIRQMLRQLLAAKGPATDDSGSQHGSRPPAEEAQAAVSSDVPAATAPKFTRLEFPRFDGREDPSAWLQRCEQFFKAQNTPGREFVSLAAFHLTGVAQTWHLRLELEDPAISWRHFKQRCYLRFGPGLRGNALGMLTYVRQNGRPVEEYTDEFQEILGLTTTVRQDQEVDLYTAGPDEWLRIDVENMHPPNLDVAMNIARSSARKQRWFSHPYAADPSFFPVPFAGDSYQPHQSAAHQPHQYSHQPH
nr:Retrotransposon gag protein [Ipomoea batatas]